jgi:hypothetical protein
VGHDTALVSPLKQILVILALVKVVIYKILEKTLVLERGINTLLDKCILFSLLIGTLCQKASKVCIDLINNWY